MVFFYRDNMSVDTRQKITETARSYKGKIKYRYPKNPEEIHAIESGMSCYHFVKFVLRGNGIFVPDNYGSVELYDVLGRTDKPETADLVFIERRSQPHVGFYVDGNIVHCAFRKGVVEEPLKEFSVKGYRTINNLIPK
jgi:hypothetical protein